MKIGPGDIGGVVTSSNGPEAGVWVIAETFELGVKRFAKIVVTDDQGRVSDPRPARRHRAYPVPDLGARLWAHRLRSGQYPAWTEAGSGGRGCARRALGRLLLSGLLLVGHARHSDRRQVPRHRRRRATASPKNLKNQQQWIQALKQNGCGNCHQAGGARMRMVSDFHLDQADGDQETAWSLRLSSGNGGPNMINAVSNLQSTDGGMLQRLADWTTRIAAGETPKQKPERPKGVERNLVVTIWDWGRSTMYMHDLITTDKRNPTVNGYGYMAGAMEVSTDWAPFLDPKNNVSWEKRMPMLSYEAPTSATENAVNAASQTFGMRQIWKTHVNAHTNMMDQDRRTYWTASVRPQWEQPAFCTDPNNASAKVFPIKVASGNPDNRTEFVQNARGVTVYDPNLDQWFHVDTCFGTHHLNFGYDADNTLLPRRQQQQRARLGEHARVLRDRQLANGRRDGPRTSST